MLKMVSAKTLQFTTSPKMVLVSIENEYFKDTDIYLNLDTSWEWYFTTVKQS